MSDRESEPPVKRDAFSEWLDGQEFYELMQAYRHAPLAPQSEVLGAFAHVKRRLVLEHARAMRLQGEEPSEG